MVAREVHRYTLYVLHTARTWAPWAHVGGVRVCIWFDHFRALQSRKVTRNICLRNYFPFRSFDAPVRSTRRPTPCISRSISYMIRYRCMYMHICICTCVLCVCACACACACACSMCIHTCVYVPVCAHSSTRLSHLAEPCLPRILDAARDLACACSISGTCAACSDSDATMSLCSSQLAAAI